MLVRLRSLMASVPQQAAQEQGNTKSRMCAQKADDTALRFVHRFDLPEQEARRVNQRITHLKILLAELR